MLPIFESKTSCRKTCKKVSMSALHPSRKTSPSPIPEEAVLLRQHFCHPELTDFKWGHLQKERASAFIFNKLSSGILRTECLFFLTMLPPIHLQKTGRQEGPAESLLVGAGGSVVVWLGPASLGFRPNSKVLELRAISKIRKTQSGDCILELRLKVKAVVLCWDKTEASRLGNAKLCCRTLDGAAGNTGERTGSGISSTGVQYTRQHRASWVVTYLSETQGFSR